MSCTKTYKEITYHRILSQTKGRSKPTNKEVFAIYSFIQFGIGILKIDTSAATFSIFNIKAYCLSNNKQFQYLHQYCVQKK